MLKIALQRGYLQALGQARKFVRTINSHCGLIVST